MSRDSFDSRAAASRKELDSHVRAGLMLISLIFVILFLWGCLASIASAVISTGKVALESSVKTVQHKEGGIVSNVYVKEGDKVAAGQLLVKLDSTASQANMDVVYREIEELVARRQRLLAERDHLDDLVSVDAEFIRDAERFERTMNSERLLFSERRRLLGQQTLRIKQKMAGYTGQIEGLESQLIAVKKQYDLVHQEATGLRQLYDRKLVSLTQKNPIERQLAELEGYEAELAASISEARASIAEAKIQILQVESSAMSEVMSELKDTEISLARALKEKATGEDVAIRTEIRSPSYGQVQELNIHTVGGVISPGEKLMLVVPDQDELIIEAMIAPQSIDQIEVGQPARIRFTAFSGSMTPELNAQVERVSREVQVDERTKSEFYLARIRLDGLQLPDILRGRLVSGMPAEVQVSTGRRMALSYFLKPMTDQLARTFKEE